MLVPSLQPLTTQALAVGVVEPIDLAVRTLAVLNLDHQRSLRGAKSESFSGSGAHPFHA